MLATKAQWGRKTPIKMVRGFQLFPRIIRYSIRYSFRAPGPGLQRTRLFSSFDPHRVRVLSFDITGTLLAHNEPVAKSYADAARWAHLPNAPNEEEFQNAFKQAFQETSFKYPCFGSQDGLSDRQWWYQMLKRTLEIANKQYTEVEFNRFFRRVYQHFGSLDGYTSLQDAVEFLSWIKNKNPDLVMGIISNTPIRSLETVLPMKGLHDYFKWHVCPADVLHEKPAKEIFDFAYSEAQFWVPDLRRNEILHIGDSMECDFCGARASGFQSLLLDRTNHRAVTKYQDWVKGPHYEGKSDEDIRDGTVRDFYAVKELLKNSPLVR